MAGITDGRDPTVHSDVYHWMKSKLSSEREEQSPSGDQWQDIALESWSDRRFSHGTSANTAHIHRASSSSAADSPTSNELHENAAVSKAAEGRLPTTLPHLSHEPTFRHYVETADTTVAVEPSGFSGRCCSQTNSTEAGTVRDGNSTPQTISNHTTTEACTLDSSREQQSGHAPWQAQRSDRGSARSNATSTLPYLVEHSRKSSSWTVETNSSRKWSTGSVSVPASESQHFGNPVVHCERHNREDKDLESLVYAALKKQANWDAVLDPSKKVQWLGVWDIHDFQLQRQRERHWQPDDVVVLPGLPGKVGMPALVHHSSLLLLFAALIVTCGVAFISFPFYMSSELLPFAVSCCLLGRGIILMLYSIFVWIVLEGSEVVIAGSYAWLDASIACSLVALTMTSSSMTIPVSIWLMTRGIWLEGMTLFSTWNEKGREWWLSFVACWPPFLLGALLAARCPTENPLYICGLLGTSCFIDGFPLWTSCVLLKVELQNGPGLLPEYARGSVVNATGQGALTHGVLRTALLGMLVVGVQNLSW